MAALPPSDGSKESKTLKELRGRLEKVFLSIFTETMNLLAQGGHCGSILEEYECLDIVKDKIQELAATYPHGVMNVLEWCEDERTELTRDYMGIAERWAMCSPSML